MCPEICLIPSIVQSLLKYFGYACLWTSQYPLPFPGETINIASIGEFLLYGNRELPPLADKEFVQQTADTPLFDMYPVSPTIDLEKRTLIQEDDRPGNLFTTCFCFTTLYGFVAKEV